jgi:predicted nucleic acid-binding protein
MPIFQIPPFEIDFSRRAVLLDTNVLYAAFAQEDQHKDNALVFLDIWDGDILIPISVIVETWGMLVGGKKKNLRAGLDLLDWLMNPGNRAFLLPQDINDAEFMHKSIRQIQIDCVDALLMSYANAVSEQCNFRPFLLIATYDFTDYLKCLGQYKLQFRLLNPDTLEEFPE